MSESNSADNNGVIKISEEVISILAVKAIREVPGFSEMSTGNMAQSFAFVLGKKNTTKGINVEIKDNNVIINMHIIVDYGQRIPEVAWNAQDAVKNAVEKATGLTVQKVNITVDNIKFEEVSLLEGEQDIQE